VAVTFVLCSSSLCVTEMFDAVSSTQTFKVTVCGDGARCFVSDRSFWTWSTVKLFLYKHLPNRRPFGSTCTRAGADGTVEYSSKNNLLPSWGSACVSHIFVHQ
jgi:hypothetical protein